MSNWKRWLQLASQILAVLLAGATAHNYQAINSGVIQDAGIPQYSLLGFEGLGSVASLAFSLFLGWKSSGSLSVTKATETASVVALFAACAADGDQEGMQMTSNIAAHFAKRQGFKPPDLSPLDALRAELQQLLHHFRPETPDAPKP